MIGIASLELTAEKFGLLMDSEVEVMGNMCLIKKKRTFTVNSGKRCFIVTLEVEISFSSYRSDGTALNKAEILLSPDEYPVFSAALSQHGISFPTNYSQRLVINPGICSLQMESREMPEAFAERLAAALKFIETKDETEQDAG